VCEPDAQGPVGVALAGFMAVGKTTVGQLLATRLGLRFVDLDEVIEVQEGTSIPTIFSTRGEAAFRAAERRALDAVLGTGPAVLALGGGTVHHADNLERVRQVMPVVVLDAPWTVIAERLADSTDRPLASGGRSLWQARRAGYLSAGPVVDVANLDPEQVVDRVMAVLA